MVAPDLTMVPTEFQVLGPASVRLAQSSETRTSRKLESALLYSIGESQIPEKTVPGRRHGLHFSGLLRADRNELSAQWRPHEGSLPFFQHAPACHQGVAAGLRCRRI